MGGRIQIKGSESLQRKLATLGKDAPKAQRWAISQGAQFVVWMLKGNAPQKKNGNELATGATKAAIGRKEQRVGANYTQWIGIRDKEYSKKMYIRTRNVGGGKFVTEYSPRKAKKKGFINQVQVNKKPFNYSFIQERRDPWFYRTWASVRGHVGSLILRKTDDRIKQILAKR